MARFSRASAPIWRSGRGQRRGGGASSPGPRPAAGHAGPARSREGRLERHVAISLRFSWSMRTMVLEEIQQITSQVSATAAPPGRGSASGSPLHRGRIQTQGNDVPADLSWAWASAQPPTAATALAELHTIRVERSPGLPPAASHTGLPSPRSARARTHGWRTGRSGSRRRTSRPAARARRAGTSRCR